jgi:hypothetical protein
MEPRHSGIGIASFILSLMVGFLIFLTIISAGVMAAVAPQGVVQEEAPAWVVLGLVLLALMFADLVALGLGIAGLCQNNRKKVFAILGIVFSSVAVGGTILLAIIGNAM